MSSPYDISSCGNPVPIPLREFKLRKHCEQVLPLEIQIVYQLARGDPLHHSFLHCEFFKKLRKTIKIIEDSVRIFGVEAIGISFNGGKDCTVLLHLLYVVLHHSDYQTHFIPNGCSNGHHKSRSIKAFYATCHSTFPEIDEFVNFCETRYSLDIGKYPRPIKQALETWHKENPEIKLILVGTRRGDPHSENLEIYSPTDEDWPAFMRVHPILDWSFTDVWLFLALFQVPYCDLYQEGYTSVGDANTTKKNECLKSENGFLPAYLLSLLHTERSGRA